MNLMIALKFIFKFYRIKGFLALGYILHIWSQKQTSIFFFKYLLISCSSETEHFCIRLCQVNEHLSETTEHKGL